MKAQSPDPGLSAPIRRRRRGGWTVERMEVFLGELKTHADVSRACDAVGLARQGVYRLRRRNPAFARAWDRSIAARNTALEASILAIAAEIGIMMPGPATPETRLDTSTCCRDVSP